MLFVQAAFQERARVDAGRGVALKIDQVARLVAVFGVEEMIEPDFEQGGQRGIGGNVAADAGVVLVLAHHHGHGVPADQALDAALHGTIAGIRHFVLGADGVDVRRVELNRQFDAVDARPVNELLHQVGRPILSGLVDHLVQCFYPLSGFPWIEVHNPLVQCLVHGYFHYSETPGSALGGYNVVMVRVEHVLESWKAIRQTSISAVEDFPPEDLDYRREIKPMRSR